MTPMLPVRQNREHFNFNLIQELREVHPDDRPLVHEIVREEYRLRSRMCWAWDELARKEHLLRFTVKAALWIFGGIIAVERVIAAVAQHVVWK